MDSMSRTDRFSVQIFQSEEHKTKLIEKIVDYMENYHKYITPMHKQKKTLDA